jgi:hypothetical protein
MEKTVMDVLELPLEVEAAKLGEQLVGHRLYLLQVPFSDLRHIHLGQGLTKTMKLFTQFRAEFLAAQRVLHLDHSPSTVVDTELKLPSLPLLLPAFEEPHSIRRR